MGVHLRQISAAEFAEYMQHSVANYAEETARADGVSLQEGMEIARQAFQRLLPDGLSSKNQYLFTVCDGTHAIGTLWFGIKGAGAGQQAFVYDIVLSPDSRGKGFGEQAMLLFEEKARELGMKKVGLHVFGHNARARRLYDKLGYCATNVMMAKEL